MSYEKTTWQSGDVITAEKLNKIEDGITQGNNDFIVITFEDRGSYISSSYTPVDVAHFLEQGKIIYAEMITMPGMVYTSSDYFYGTYNNAIIVGTIVFNFIGLNKAIETIYAYDDGDSIFWNFRNY